MIEDSKEYLLRVEDTRHYPYNNELKSIKNKFYTAAVMHFFISYINEKKNNNKI